MCIKCVLHLLLIASLQKAEAPWKVPSSSELDNLIKKLKLPALRNKAPAPEDLPRQSEGDQTGAQDPATKRAVPINQYNDQSCGEEVRKLPQGTTGTAVGWALCDSKPKIISSNQVQQHQQQHLASTMWF